MNSILIISRTNQKLRFLFTDTDSVMNEIKTKNVYDDFSKNKKLLNFSNYSAKSKYYDDSNALVVSKTKERTDGAATQELIVLKPKTYSILVSDSGE